MDLSWYKEVLGAKSIPESNLLNTANHVNDIFTNSASCKSVTYNGEVVDAIVSIKDETTSKILFRPYTNVNVGDYIELEGDTLIAFETKPNEIYPKAKVKLCNCSLNWKKDDGQLVSYKCNAQGASYKDEENKVIVTSDAEVNLFVQYNEDTKKIIPKQRFVINGTTYEVTSIDDISKVYQGVGIIRLGMSFTSSTTTDDVVGDVADDSGNSGWGDW